MPIRTNVNFSGMLPSLLIVVVGLVVGLFSNPITARAESFGVGAVIGDPTGISVKMWLNRTTAIDGAFAWSMAGQRAIHVQGDYLFHELSFFHLGKLPMNLYYGAGGRISSYSGNSKTGLGLAARAPLGTSYKFKKTPVELFAELALVLELTPSTEAMFNLGIGGRYYF